MATTSYKNVTWDRNYNQLDNKFNIKNNLYRYEKTIKVFFREQDM